MPDEIKRDQEVVELRQHIEQTYANNPAVLDALRSNADALDLELRGLPPGTPPVAAIEHLGTKNWFREATEAATSEGARRPADPPHEQTPDAAGYGQPTHPEVTLHGAAPLNNKRYVGHVLQYDPQPANFWTLDWILSLTANDVVRWLPGWVITQPIGPHPVESRGKCFVAERAYMGASGRSSVVLYFSAIDLGFRVDQNGYRFHATKVDANFVDSGRTWDALAAEQIVAEALALLYDTFTAASTGPDMPFWYRLSGSWVCGTALYQCPDWTG
jgi:hypothetical protein